MLQCNTIQYTYFDMSIYCIGQYTYCSVLHILCELELDHWNVNVDKLLFLYEN